MCNAMMPSELCRVHRDYDMLLSDCTIMIQNTLFLNLFQTAVEL